MLDIKFLRSNPDVVKQNIKNKFQEEKLPLVDEVIELDKRNREIKQEVEALRAEKNKASKEIGAMMAQKKLEEAEALKKKVAESNGRINELSEEEKEEIRSQVEEYRKFAPLIQTGLYYRLSDPSKEEYAAWAFVSEDQKEVLLNVVMQEIHGNMTVNYVNLQGLKCSAVYRDTETGKTYNGAALMEAGIPMPVEMGEFKAYQMHLVGEE